eukprot:m51a1_g3304 hypothetical protein (744) ;mRNA; r:317583-320371
MESSEVVPKDKEKRSLFERVAALFTTRHTSDLYERQAATVARRIVDMRHVVSITDSVLKMIEGGYAALFDPALCALINACSSPFIRESASDHIKNQEYVRTLFARLGAVLLSPHVSGEAQAAASRALTSAFGEAFSPPEFYQQQVKLSGAAAAVSRALTTAVTSSDGATYPELANCAAELSYVPELAEQMRPWADIPALIRAAAHSERVLVFVWNLIELDPLTVTSLEPEPTAEATKWALLESSKDREIFNDLLAICGIISMNPRSAKAFADTKLTNLLLSSLELCPRVDKLESQKLLYTSLQNITRQKDCMDPHLQLEGFQCLLRFLQREDVDIEGDQVAKELTIRVLGLLIQLVEHYPTSFHQCHGVQALAHLLKRASPGSLVTNSSLRLLQAVSVFFAAEFLEYEPIPLLVGILGGNTQMLALMCIASLCDHDPNHAHFLDENAFKMFGSLLKHDERDPNHRDELPITAVDCIWCGVSGNPKNALLLANSGGVESLLGLLCKCPAYMQSIVLGCLSDLSEENCIRDKMLQWKADGETVIPMLLRIWVQEEKRLSVQVDAGGVIAATEAPLSSYFERNRKNEWRKYRKLPTMGRPSRIPLHALFADYGVFKSTSSLASLNTDDKRFKIYSIFCNLGFANTSGMIIDEIKLMTISRYEELISGHEFMSIQEELAVEGTTLVEEDDAVLKDCIKEYRRLKEGIRTKEQTLMHNKSLSQITEEKRSYVSLVQRMQNTVSAVPRV